MKFHSNSDNTDGETRVNKRAGIQLSISLRG